MPPLVSVAHPNVVVETVKPCEDTQSAYILRLYEAAGDWTRTSLRFAQKPDAVIECNMLEAELAQVDPDNLVFEPFRIRTFKVVYSSREK